VLALLQEKIMAEKRIYITENDKERLEAFIEHAEQFGYYRSFGDLP